MSVCLAGRLSNSVTACMAVCLVGCFTGCMSGCVSVCLSAWLVFLFYITGWLSGRVPACLLVCLPGWLCYWLAAWSCTRLSACTMSAWLVYVTGCLYLHVCMSVCLVYVTGWLPDWLIALLAGCPVVYLPVCMSVCLAGYVTDWSSGRVPAWQHVCLPSLRYWLAA